ncbi:hypothetical protein [Herbaspirillum huttiense]|uniref:hypothetical protein n=1 Tax=Herbaspirillum huttiense TaxID=863372 RepID=UPI0031CE5805
MKKAFYDEATKRLIAIGFLEEIAGGVGVEVADDFDAPLYVTQWDGKEFTHSPVPANFTVATPEDLAAAE